MTIDSKPVRAIRATFSTRADGERGTRTRVLVSGVHAKDLDLTGNVTGAIAHALWQARGGDAASNWVEAERILEQLAGAPARPAGSAQTPEPVRTAAPERVGAGGGGGEAVMPGRRRMSR